MRTNDGQMTGGERFGYARIQVSYAVGGWRVYVVVSFIFSLYQISLLVRLVRGALFEVSQLPIKRVALLPIYIAQHILHTLQDIDGGHPEVEEL